MYYINRFSTKTPFMLTKHQLMIHDTINEYGRVHIHLPRQVGSTFYVYYVLLTYPEDYKIRYLVHNHAMVNSAYHQLQEFYHDDGHRIEYDRRRIFSINESDSLRGLYGTDLLILDNSIRGLKRVSVEIIEDFLLHNPNAKFVILTSGHYDNSMINNLKTVVLP